jgi:hypothetical protein
MALVRWQEIEDMFDRYSRAVGLPRTGGHEPVATGDWSPRVKSFIESSDTTEASPVALHCLTMSMKLKLRLLSRMAC